MAMDEIHKQAPTEEMMGIQNPTPIAQGEKPRSFKEVLLDSNLLGKKRLT